MRSGPNKRLYELFNISTFKQLAEFINHVIKCFFLFICLVVCWHVVCLTYHRGGQRANKLAFKGLTASHFDNNFTLEFSLFGEEQFRNLRCIENEPTGLAELLNLLSNPF